ncbi:hypothetical protein CYY_009680 [Polysphondylium violaceum]|uniref:NUC153 domain-containing protein n=1 Tax=Polysphondylium violaceum TaxID=133409 RepID=A0A8J4PLY2_9MYCE|nr:hypothetical protein CYY_009680 [Polysphondylium violaceum]
MNLLTTNGVKIYNVSAGKSLPEWLSEKKREELRKNEEFRSRIELIQDFSFETSSQRLKFTPDGQYIMATGIYPPQVKVFEVSQLSSKLTRNLDCHVVQFEILSEDYSKPVFLRDDRYIEFHAKFGNYFKTRIPKLGRDMTYHKPSCDLYITASGTEVYRLNLEEGRFLAPLQTHLNGGVNVIAQNPVHQLMMLGGENGFIECWDPRVREMISTINVAAALPDYQNSDVDISITAGKFGPDGLLLGLGTSNGSMLMYDLRSAQPSLIRHHQYQLPINSINFHTSTDGSLRVMSSDPKILKVFDKNDGKLFMTLEPKHTITDVLVQDGSGLVMMPGNTSKVQTYYVPNLGPAPRWCSFLDNLTEELEEDKQLVYEDYKFITRDEVEKYGIQDMVGTGYLKAYMHGYFMHIKLYNKIKSLDHFEYDKYQKEKVDAQLKKSTESRISLKDKKPSASANNTPKINAKFAEKLRAIPKVEQTDTAKERSEAVINAMLNDTRFGEMFKENDFIVDENSEAFAQLYPRNRVQKLDKSIAEHFDKVDYDDNSDDQDSDDDEDFDNDDSEQETKYNENDDSEEEYIPKKKAEASKKVAKKPINFYEIKQGHSLPSIKKSTASSQMLKSAPFAVRVSKESKKITGLDAKDEMEGTKITKNDNGDLEISFVPSKKKKDIKKKPMRK